MSRSNAFSAPPFVTPRFSTIFFSCFPIRSVSSTQALSIVCFRFASFAVSTTAFSGSASVFGTSQTLIFELFRALFSGVRRELSVIGRLFRIFRNFKISTLHICIISRRLSHVFRNSKYSEFQNFTKTVTSLQEFQVF